MLLPFLHPLEKWVAIISGKECNLFFPRVRRRSGGEKTIPFSSKGSKRTHLCSNPNPVQMFHPFPVAKKESPFVVKNDSREGEETATKGPSGSPSPSSFASVEFAFPVGSRREVEISSLLQENK